MTLKQRAKAEHILDVISGNRFAMFYGMVGEDDICPLSLFLGNLENAPSREDILLKIVELFSIPA